MTTFYIIYFAGVIVALLLYILSLCLSIKAGLEEIPSLASELGSKEQQKMDIIMTIFAHPFAYLLSWLSAIAHIFNLVDHCIWRYKQRVSLAADRLTVNSDTKIEIPLKNGTVCIDRVDGLENEQLMITSNNSKLFRSMWVHPLTSDAIVVEIK